MSNFIEKIKIKTEKRIESLPEYDTIACQKHDFCQMFESPQRYSIISEIKFASPSKGQIYKYDLSPVDIAESYLENGASALSILTEPEFFNGDIDFINQVRDKFPQANILQKDFILSTKQIDQAIRNGANAVLLIVSFLEKQQLTDLYNYSIANNITPLVEIHNEAELDIAMSLSPKLLGINNRNLHTLKTDLQTSKDLIKKIPKNQKVISESGLSSIKELEDLKKIGFDGFLIGSHFMEYKNPGHILKEFLNNKLEK